MPCPPVGVDSVFLDGASVSGGGILTRSMSEKEARKSCAGLMKFCSFSMTKQRYVVRVVSDSVASQGGAGSCCQPFCGRHVRNKLVQKMAGSFVLHQHGAVLGCMALLWCIKPCFLRVQWFDTVVFSYRIVDRPSCTKAGLVPAFLTFGAFSLS